MFGVFFNGYKSDSPTVFFHPYETGAYVYSRYVTSVYKTPTIMKFYFIRLMIWNPYLAQPVEMKKNNQFIHDNGDLTNVIESKLLTRAHISLQFAPQIFLLRLK